MSKRKSGDEYGNILQNLGKIECQPILKNTLFDACDLLIAQQP
jgi:hypothetical protein